MDRGCLGGTCIRVISGANFCFRASLEETSGVKADMDLRVGFMRSISEEAG